MKLLGVFRSGLIFLAFANSSCAQTSSAPAPPDPAQPSPQATGPTIAVRLPQPTKTIGKAKVYYDEARKRSTATVDFYVVGRPEDILKVDVLSITTQIEGPGKEPLKPESVTFSIYSYSHGIGYKYKNDPKLSIFIDGALFLTGVCDPSFAAIDPRGGVTERYFSPRLTYGQFVNLLKAEKLSMEFGGTGFPIEGDNLAALKDLYRSVSP